MRRMTLAEQQKVMEALAHNRHAADMMCFDSICYGGVKEVENYRDQREYVSAVIKAFPADILKAYDAGLRKQKADELRKKADAVERGTLAAE